MDKTQFSRLAMYRALHTFFQNNLEIIKGIQAFGELIPVFTDLIDKIEKMLRTQTTVAQEKTAIKQSEKSRMVTSLFHALSAMHALGHALGDVALENSTDFTRPTLERTRDHELLNLADVTLERVNTYADQLVKYSVSAEDIARFTKDRDTYYKSLHDLDAGIAARKATRPNLSTLFSNGNTLITKQFDPMMEVLRISRPELYEEYRKARSVRFRGIRHRPPDEVPAASTTPQTDSTPSVPTTAPVLQPAADTKQ
jgi:hypothetical protein